MDREELEHLKETRRLRILRLRELEKRQAREGNTCPPEVENEIRDIRAIVRTYDNHLRLAETSVEEVYQNTYEVDEAVSTEGSPIGGFIVLGVVALITIFGIGSCMANANSTKLNDTFNITSGLGSWRTNGSVVLVKDGREEDYTKGSVQLQGANSYLFQVVDEKTSEAGVYTATVWCKAPLGSRCRLFLGDVQEGISAPIVESSRTITRDGTDQWESMAVTTSIITDTRLGVFLYAEGKAQNILYDDVLVKK